ncbi:hypothetical protein SAG0136_03895 [Streptococcus agalactiae LMG 14747]|uniref:Uncharacterized protein n=1 Tax=Streptococcus agalactiae LMG 14747 TaxID=1154860 RepID=V6Z0D5_STRAG|nr:hypothetical protein SAG0136_03895 [Streptococcus agalactiae LMG 14747]
MKHFLKEIDFTKEDLLAFINSALAFKALNLKNHRLVQEQLSRLLRKIWVCR